MGLHSILVPGGTALEGPLWNVWVVLMAGLQYVLGRLPLRFEVKSCLQRDSGQVFAA